MRQVWKWLTSSNWKTWLGHAVLAGLITWLVVWAAGPSEAFWAILISFFYRELTDFDRHGREDAPEEAGPLGYLRAGWASFAADGYFDLVTPFIGFGVAMLLLGHGTGEYAALAIVTLILALGLSIGGHRLLKGQWPWQGMD